ncbi:MAG: hypothetical protein L0G23_05965 [Ruaniaceae bacterium]|nr:hypothetical protein [Ruaniaceae bacterium]
MPNPPSAIRAASLFGALSAITLVVGAAIEIVRTRDFATGSLVTAGFYVLVALIIVPISLKLRTGSPGARSVVITWSLILVLAMITLVQILGWQAYMGIAFGIATLVSLALPSARAFIRPRSL